jgi:histone-lysine N-methyltransferase SETMAR
VIQLGCLENLQVFAVGSKGYGVRCPQPISRGSFVIEYVGERLCNSEANKRISLYLDQLQRGISKSCYLIDVREKFKNGTSIRTMIDAEKRGNIAR